MLTLLFVCFADSAALPVQKGSKFQSKHPNKWVTYEELIAMFTKKMGYNHAVAALGLLLEFLNKGRMP